MRSRMLIESAMTLTDKLLDAMDAWSKVGRVPWSKVTRVRDVLRTDWIALITTHLVDHHSFPRGEGPHHPFPRPVICAWCGNRYRAVVPDDVSKRHTQGATCAAAVFQVTEAILTRTKNPGYVPHAAPELVYVPRAAPELVLGEWLVQGHYGSSDYDCALFRFVRDPPAAAADPICDNCVGERIGAGDLQQIEGNYP